MKFAGLLITLCTSSQIIVTSAPVDDNNRQHYHHLSKRFNNPIEVYAEENDNEPIEYEFQYFVHDPESGDIKSHHEERKNDIVKGRYELLDPDGYKRTVEYTADDIHGFRVTVHREPIDIRVAQPELSRSITNYSHQEPEKLSISEAEDYQETKNLRYRSIEVVVGGYVNNNNDFSKIFVTPNPGAQETLNGTEEYNTKPLTPKENQSNVERDVEF